DSEYGDRRGRERLDGLDHGVAVGVSDGDGRTPVAPAKEHGREAADAPAPDALELRARGRPRRGGAEARDGVTCNVFHEFAEVGQGWWEESGRGRPGSAGGDRAWWVKRTRRFRWPRRRRRPAGWS